MDNLERFYIYTYIYIYNVTGRNSQINDKSTVKYNAIFDTVIYINAYRGHSPP